MHILYQIVETKKQEVQSARHSKPIGILESSPFFSKPTNSLVQSLLAEKSSLIIAEHKRKSPSKGQIYGGNLSQVDIVQGYKRAGAAGSSVLTDKSYFGGDLSDLKVIREHIASFALLRKDFIIDEYQLFEAKANGADVILLIAACLSVSACKSLAKKAKELGLEVLLEVHDAEELKTHMHEYVDILGVNNRNLKTFEVSLDVSKKLSALIPKGVVKITESGIDTIDDFAAMYDFGYRGFLIGEQFMKTQNPGEACQIFISTLRKKIYGTDTH